MGRHGDRKMILNITYIAKCLKAHHIKSVFGLVGIPVTSLAFELQREGMDFFAHRSEASAGFAAAAYSYLTSGKSGLPAIMLSTGGPGFVNSLSSIAHATVNRIPLVLIAGSANPKKTVGSEAFQELDQLTVCNAVPQLCKKGFCCSESLNICSVLSDAIQLAMSFPQGGVYVDIPTAVLDGCTDLANAKNSLDAIQSLKPVRSSSLAVSFNKIIIPPLDKDISSLKRLLENAGAPLIVAGKGVAMSHAENLLSSVAVKLQFPVLPTPMGRGVIEDNHPLCVSANRSRALNEADVVLLIGARLNWMLHMGDPPRWRSDALFVIIDGDAELESRKIALYIHADIISALQRLEACCEGIDTTKARPWVEDILSSARSRKLAEVPLLDKSTDRSVYLSHQQAIKIVRDEVNDWQKSKGHRDITLISEGSNTMDLSRVIMPVYRARGRLDAGTWGTMGVGLAYCLSAYITDLLNQADPREDHLVIAIEGDSAIGFSIMELETLARYKIPALIIVLNNGGIYTGATSNSSVPLPTQLSQDTRYDLLCVAMGGTGKRVQTAEDLRSILSKTLEKERSSPTVIDVVVDPEAFAPSDRASNFMKLSHLY